MASQTSDQTARSREQMSALLDRIIPFATAADALARRSVGKVRALALLGLLAALWIAYACADSFDLGLGTLLTTFVVVAIPSAILWKVYGTLNATVGLPQRILDTAAKIHDRAIEYRDEYAKRDPVIAKPRLRQLWQTGRAFLEIKGMSDEAKAIASQAGGALLLANPLFGIVLAVTSGVILLLIAAACVIGLVYLL